MISTVTTIEPAVEPTAARDLAPWPSARSRRIAIVAQFGGDRADLAQWALTTADPLADAVAAAIHAEGEAVRAAFSTGVTDAWRPSPIRTRLSPPCSPAPRRFPATPTTNSSSTARPPITPRRRRCTWCR